LTWIPSVNKVRDRDDDWMSATIAGPEFALKVFDLLGRICGDEGSDNH
jgi:hypothetical protein